MRLWRTHLPRLHGKTAGGSSAYSPKAPIIFFLAFVTGFNASGRTVVVRDTFQLSAAVRNARPGDIIELNDGTYFITTKLHAAAQGTQAAPIIGRATHDKRAHIRASAQIAFEVSGGHWRFTGLDIAGICTLDTECEHAFHVTGASTGFVLSGSRLADFNAHIKVNADQGHVLPDHGLIEGNEFFDSHPRRTGNPVAPINIDNAVGWTVRSNLIHDFQKDGEGEGSYGAFVKGGARAPLIERNQVICARDLPPMGRMVGLSFGADGMDANLCPPHWDSLHPCDPEVLDGVMRSNTVMNCNGGGIYLNKARNSTALSNRINN